MCAALIINWFRHVVCPGILFCMLWNWKECQWNSCAFCHAFGGVKSKPGKAAHFTKVFFMSTYSPLYHHHQQCNCNFAHSTCLSYAPASTFFPHQKICSLGNKKGMRGKYCISYQLLFALKNMCRKTKSTITCCTLPDWCEVAIHQDLWDFGILPSTYICNQGRAYASHMLGEY